MLTDAERAALEAAWAPARTGGVLGSTTVEDLWEHTAGYASAVCSSSSGHADDLELRIIDVGTGAGVPGLLLAAQLPRCHVALLDASERRLDHVRRARRALGLAERSSVHHGRADVLGHDAAYRAQFDVAVARLLADPAETLELLLPLVREGGLIVVSSAHRHLPFWRSLDPAVLPIGAVTVSDDPEPIVSVGRSGPLPDAWPRREKARRRTPLGPS